METRAPQACLIPAAAPASGSWCREEHSAAAVSWGQHQRGWWETPAAKAANVHMIGLAEVPLLSSSVVGGFKGSLLVLSCSKLGYGMTQTKYVLLLFYAARPWFLDPQEICWLFVVQRFPCSLLFVAFLIHCSCFVCVYIRQETDIGTSLAFHLADVILISYKKRKFLKLLCESTLGFCFVVAMKHRISHK